jgi:hypothetical protein
MNSDLVASSNRPAPFNERTHPEIAVMLGTYQMSTEVEEISDSSVDASVRPKLKVRFQKPVTTLQLTAAVCQSSCRVLLCGDFYVVTISLRI